MGWCSGYVPRCAGWRLSVSARVTSTTDSPDVLPRQIGFFFSAFMIGISWMQNRYTDAKTGNVEEFTSASKSVKPGLIASGIVSAWTWAATLLQSSAVAYKFGIAGPWWYAAGAAIQVM